jgi:hypothetical protein
MIPQQECPGLEFTLKFRITVFTEWASIDVLDVQLG